MRQIKCKQESGIELESYHQLKKCTEKYIIFSWCPGNKVRAKWQEVVERGAIWVTFDLSMVSKAGLCHICTPPTTEAEDDSGTSSRPYGMQKFTIFPSCSVLSLTKFRLSPKGTNKGKNASQHFPLAIALGYV